MFEGKAGKDLMIRQGYVPPTCTLPPDHAGLLIYTEVAAGRSPCWGCNDDRAICHGQPRQADAVELGMVKIKEATPYSKPSGREKHIVGLDLGQTTDPSALCLLTRYDKMVASRVMPAVPEPIPPPMPGIPPEHLKPLETFVKKPEAGGLTHALDFFKAGDPAFDEDLPAPPVDPLKEMMKRHYACRALKRWPLGTSYVDIVDDVRRLDQRLDDMVLVIDNTGVGRPVMDIFRRAKLRCRVVPITITAGRAGVAIPRHDEKTGEFWVSKIELISAIQVVLQTRRIRFIEGMAEAITLMGELREYKVKVSAALNEIYNAREGEHDDLVLAAALALWWGEKAPMQLRGW